MGEEGGDILLAMVGFVALASFLIYPLFWIVLIAGVLTVGGAIGLLSLVVKRSET